MVSGASRSIGAPVSLLDFSAASAALTSASSAARRTSACLRDSSSPRSEEEDSKAGGMRSDPIDVIRGFPSRSNFVKSDMESSVSPCLGSRDSSVDGCSGFGRSSACSEKSRADRYVAASTLERPTFVSARAFTPVLINLYESIICEFVRVGTKVRAGKAGRPSRRK